MRVLILGASGLAGRAVYRKLSGKHEVFGTYFSKGEGYERGKNDFFLDIGKEGDRAAALKKLRPHIVVSCLRGDFRQQIQAHMQMADYLSGVPGGKLIFLSTANVFDGDESVPHYEEDELCPESEYGKFKAQCEREIRKRLGERAVILRLPFIWGKEAPLLKQLEEASFQGKSFPAWSNLYTNHTTDRQIADYVDFIIEEKRTGIFHIGTEEACEYLSFLRTLCRRLRFPKPSFELEELPSKTYLAVLTNRQRLPERLKLRMTDFYEEIAVTHSGEKKNDKEQNL